MLYIKRSKMLYEKTHFFSLLYFSFFPSMFLYTSNPEFDQLINKIILQIYTDSKLLLFIKLQRDTIEQVKSKAITHPTWHV